MRPEVFAATAASSLSMRPLTEMISLGVFDPRKKNHQIRAPARVSATKMTRMTFFEWLLGCDIAPSPYLLPGAGDRDIVAGKCGRERVLQLAHSFVVIGKRLQFAASRGRKRVLAI